MFLVDEYIPENIDDSMFHHGILDRLRRMSNDNAIPHIILYGPEGVGKRTIIRLFLKELYGPSVENIKDVKYKITGSGNTTTEVNVKQSNHHIVIHPYNNNFDRYFVQTIVKEYARKLTIFNFTKKSSFKTVYIDNVGNMSYYAQTSLRRTMEMYSDSCRFIMWTDTFSKVIDPIQSRCLCIRVNAPTKDEMFKWLMDVSIRKRINISMYEYIDILKHSERSIKEPLWILSLRERGLDYKNTIYKSIDTLANILIDNSLDKVPEMRLTIYDMLITYISPNKIIRMLTDAICLKDLGFNKINEIVQNAAKFEHRLLNARRSIIHLDAFLVNVIRIVNS